MAQIIELSVAALNSMTVEELIEKHSQLFDEVVEMNRSINAQCSVMSNKLRVLNQYSERIDQLI